MHYYVHLCVTAFYVCMLYFRVFFKLKEKKSSRKKASILQTQIPADSSIDHAVLQFGYRQHSLEAQPRVWYVSLDLYFMALGKTFPFFFFFFKETGKYCFLQLNIMRTK